MNKVTYRKKKDRMRIKHKKIFISGTAVTVAGILGIGALLQTSVSVQASTEMMPGIEEIIKNASTDNEPFRILEIVDEKSEAEIGYYISGQEPYVKLYQYTDKNGKQYNFSSLKDGLSKIEDAKTRKEFAENKKYDDQGNLTNESTGIKDISYATQGDNVPLSYSEYQEQYFTKPDKTWEEIKFKNADGTDRTEKISVQGKYVPNESGTGDYTKQDQTYYPIREGTEDNSNLSQKFRENIQNFFFSEGESANAPYYLEFEEVTNDSVNQKLSSDSGRNILSQEYDYSQNHYGYYENVYSNLTTDLADNVGTYPGENPTKPTNEPILSIDPVVETEKFSEETDPTFTSNEVATQSSDTSGDGSNDVNSFGSGEDVGNSISAGDEFSDSEQASSNIDTNATTTDDTMSAQAATDQQTGTDSEIESDNKNSTSGNNKTTLKPTTAGIEPGTAENPYVYLGTTINTYPYYSYTAVTDLTAAKKEAKENEQKKKEVEAAQQTYVPEEGAITIEDGQYYYWQKSGNDMVKSPITIITGKQPVAYSDLHNIDTTNLKYNYYYRVSAVYFCCKKQDGDTSLSSENYKYYGWYYPSYPQGEDTYLPVKNGEVPTYYISDAQYELTPGKGDYDFEQGTGDGTQQYEVEINHMYYTGGYKNNDWFKRYVFHLYPDKKDTKDDFKNFNIEVTTLTKDEFNTEYVQNDSAKAAAQNDSDENSDSLSTEISTGDDTTAETTSDNSQPESTEADEEQTLEVENIVSGAGVELVSIENEISDFSDDSENDTLSADSSDNSNETAVETANTSETDTSETDTTDSDFQNGTTSDADVFSDDTDAFSAGDANESSDSSLKDFDLIYINSDLSKEQADVIVSYNEKAKISSEEIPCIINSAKATPTATSTSQLTVAFSGFYKEGDADQHYVNQFVYFFNNTFQDQSRGNLLSTVFDTNFNPDSDDNISDGTQDTSGFEEILEYIESENKYRQLGTTTGDQQSVTPIPAAELLDNKLSHAKAIEYIINYRLKRTQIVKDKINVLEIQPAKSSGQVQDYDILEWIGDSGFSIESCGQKDSGNRIQNVLKSDKTYWMSDKKGTHEGKHWIKLTLNEASDIKGIIYTPMPIETNSNVGIPYRYTVQLYDADGRLLKEYSSQNDWYAWGKPISDRNRRLLNFGETINSVKTVKFIFDQTYGDIENDPESGAQLYASARQFGVIYAKSKVNITTMTASEFVGHIDDINTEYDMIYIGDDSTNRDAARNGDGNDMLYAHVGGLFNASSTGKWKLMGLFSQDFNSNGIDLNRNSPTAGFRGSGNDITNQQYEELMSFVKSGYPVIVADSLIAGNDVNTKTVDNSSYYYKFLKNALKYPNVAKVAELEEESNRLSFYANLAKPEIVFSEGGRPPEAPRDSYTENTEIKDDEGKVINTYNYIDGALTYKFKIKNDSAVSVTNTKYDCRLYFDLNFDGNLSDAEEQGTYIEIKDSAGTVQARITDDQNNGYYQLREGEEYTVTRKIPSDYYKMIEWKLEIINTSNTNIRTSVIGYAKQKRKDGSKVPINVLQIVPDKTVSADKVSDYDEYRINVGGTWDLAKDVVSNRNGLGDMLNAIDDFTVNITRKTVTKFDESPDSCLSGKSMVIIGFDDVYQNISENGVEKIKAFIQAGKSVIFSHDTTSFYNYLPEKIDKDKTTVYDNFLSKHKRFDWGVSMNTTLREIVGMDRYGITSNKELSKTQKVSDLLKNGENLTDGKDVSFSDLIKLTGDIAYETNAAGKISNKYTQGYTNSQITDSDLNRISAEGDKDRTTKATKVNDGVITQYPYVIPSGIDIATTHSQYYQLALEKDCDINGQSDKKNDIVVWYCLASEKDGKGNDTKVYGLSPNDVRNNYYFYSKGNVIYTGAGHSPVSQGYEIKLFINAIVAAANVTSVEPEVNFIKSRDPAAETEAVRYYATDQATWTSSDEAGNVLIKDEKLYFNVKDYNMVSASLSNADNSGKEMTAEIYIEDDANGQVMTQTGNMANVKVRNITQEIGQLIPYKADAISLGTDGKFHLVNNNAYEFTLKNVEQYLKSGTNGYKADCKIYVKVTSKVKLYGDTKEKSSYAVIDLKQRQLFDLD